MLDENRQWFCILVCNFLTSKHYWSRCRFRWENPYRGQYPFQPIKFMNLVVPSPCETELYNKYYYSFKIFSRFWLVKTTRIIHQKQLLFTKFGKNLRHIESMILMVMEIVITIRLQSNSKLPSGVQLKE